MYTQWKCRNNFGWRVINVTMPEYESRERRKYPLVWYDTPLLQHRTAKKCGFFQTQIFHELMLVNYRHFQALIEHNQFGQYLQRNLPLTRRKFFSDKDCIFTSGKENNARMHNWSSQFTQCTHCLYTSWDAYKPKWQLVWIVRNSGALYMAGKHATMVRVSVHMPF